MRIWDALRASIEQGVWVARVVSHDNAHLVRYAYRWDAMSGQWLAATKLRPGDKWAGQWSRPTLPLGDILISWTWEIVEVD